MAYNSRHSIFLQKQKLMFIKSHYDENGICFVRREAGTLSQFTNSIKVTMKTNAIGLG